MDIYKRAKAKITTTTVLVSLGILLMLWLCIFVTDYIMFSIGNPTIFSRRKVVEVEDVHKTYETGLGYKVSINEDNQAIMYLFGLKIKSR